MLIIKNITKSFQQQPVLTNVSLTATGGELIHISGPNGCGKSTLFKIVSGLLLPDEGKVELEKGDVLGALIENPQFLEYETAMTNLRFLGNLNHRFDMSKTETLLQQFGLDIHNHQPVSKYSVGMRQKLGIIQAVMENQNIILLDEPTRGLDPDSIKQFIKLLTHLKQEKKLVIVASHDQIAGLAYDRSLILQAGQLDDA
ncbi:ABC transporter ATP-binding protein [Lactobacillus sp. DCY120]|uniref:ABC transporter ATP-binding protein n=1 Tax=Bombilactobacillus apium TaxID=2675299 RepID=A0A850R5Z6_9LACO|nr:ABC transporter ATP-binding protein [Bombilactobacillus apium]NVY95965.1 ABC transporter ATP-binding protein [Bombilactobacillus apium]